MEAKKRKKIICWSIAVLLGIAAQHYLGWLVSLKPAFNGRVIDAETKEPIEGAVVAVIYRWYPIIGTPGGVNSVEYDAKETLTNEKGEFHISTTFVVTGPFGVNPHVEFIIFKPGYGSHPGLNVRPLDKMSQWAVEQFFYAKAVGEPGTIAEEGEEWVKYKVTFGVVELPKLKTWKERRIRSSGLFPVLPPRLERKLPMLKKLTRAEGVTSR
jgi:hypothetical protein